MKYLIITGVFILGMSLGYVAGTQHFFSETESDELATSNPVQTGFHQSGSESDHESGDKEDEESYEETETDTSEVYADSLNALMIVDSTLADENISTEKLVKTSYLPIVYLNEETESDTAMKELLGIEDVQTSSIFVEFWESPLNFEGYKLSRKKLIVYGLSTQFDYKIYKDGSDYFFSYQNIYYKMKETQDFLPFVEVSKSEVFHD